MSKVLINVDLMFIFHITRKGSSCFSRDNFLAQKVESAFKRMEASLNVRPRPHQIEFLIGSLAVVNLFGIFLHIVL